MIATLKTLKPWLSVIMAAALVTLYLTGKVEGPLALGLVAALEGGLVLWALWGVYKSLKGFRTATGDPWKGLETALSDLMPAQAARLLVMEFRLWGSLYAWMRRRPYRAGDFPYHSRSQMGLLMGVIILTTPLEIAILEILIPWPWLRIVTLILALYALLWIIMLFSSLRSMPHRMTDEGLELRYGALAGGFIPYEQIAEAHVALARPPKTGDGLQVDQETAYLAVGGETNLVVRLTEPLSLDRALGQTPPVRVIHFATDEPKRMIERLVARVAPPEVAPELSDRT